MTPYAIAWTVMVVAGLLLGGLVFWALRGFKWLRYVCTVLTVVWATTPYQFDEQHTAPAFLVALLRMPFVDQSADPREAVLTLGAVTLGVLVAALLLSVVFGVSRRLARRIGATRR